MTFVLASNNASKLREMKEILSELGIDVISQAEAGLRLDVEETGTTFAENAMLKAEAACSASGQPSIADDSGLMVDYLNGAPGVFSARYGSENGEKLTDDERNGLLLRNMEPAENRAARFVSSIACVFPDGTTVTAEGECRGVILRGMRGENGFGYDPLFLIPEKGKTMAELTADEKNEISHRGRALRAFALNLQNYLKAGTVC